MKAEERKVSESVVETIHIVRPNHLNGADRLFGGILMQWIDEVAVVAAKQTCKNECDHSIRRQSEVPPRCVSGGCCDYYRKRNVCRN